MATSTPLLTLIRTKEQFAAALGVPLALVERRAFTTHQKLLYERLQLPKRDGTSRVIYAPHWPLKNLQKKISGLLDEIYRPSSRAMGYVSGRGIRRNAQLHLGKRLLLNFDLKDFFPSINFGRIYYRLQAEPYNLPPAIALRITKLCTLENSLPIGSPASPVLSNIIASHLDGVLKGFARAHGAFYSRYVDDITLSTNRRSFSRAIAFRSTEGDSAWLVGSDLEEAVSSAGFTINPSKTRVQGADDRQSVCGVTVNERLNAPRSLIREVRGALNAWEKFGRKDANVRFQEAFNWRGAEDLESSLRGRIEYIKYISGTNIRSVSRLIERFNNLSDIAGKEIFILRF